jgi:NIMA (never in mitosis gene a)-related kinase 1/4/5
MNDFEIMAKLGEGAYSSVYKVKRLVDESIYALKKVKLVNLSNREIHNAVNEVRILASIRHPNIIGYKEAFYDAATKSLWYSPLHPVSSWSTLTAAISS